MSSLNELHPILHLTPPSAEQWPAVVTVDRDVVLTAGAGTGKTRTLVARILHLLAQGLPARNIVAVTFTVKAAREMRNRLRKEIADYLAQPGLPPAEYAAWDALLVELEAARIGTIHSLCAEILRSHPAEANVDPAFAVLDEALALQLRAEAIADAVGWAADDPDAVRLFTLFTPDKLDVLLESLLSDSYKSRRLFADRLWERWEELAAAELAAALDDAELNEAMGTLLGWQASGGVDAALSRGDVLAPAVQDLLCAWQQVCTYREAGDLASVFECLPRLSAAGGGNKGKAANWPTAPKPVMGAFRSAYARVLKPVVDKVDISLDGELAGLLPCLQAAFERALATYAARKQERHFLDFDDLEQRVFDLLSRDADVLARWRDEAGALLVDEFQDTNERQRQLVDLLNAGRGRLFIVGDAKQSIYRFRGAEVEVFRRARSQIASDGLACELVRSHRTHRQLLAGLNGLLATIMGEEELAAEPWHEPFAALDAVRADCDPPLAPPFVELHIAAGSKSDGALDRAAACLAQRLQELLAESSGKLGYGDIAVLCRGSRSFAAYEDAFEAAGIPYETVAGRGFLDRPEIRDLLNALAALTDLTNDLALYGLLRSPAIGLPDTELHRLRLAGAEQRTSLWQMLAADDSTASRRAVELIEPLAAQVGRVAVADLLKQFVDATHYRAILLQAGDMRAARNVSKLLQDAQRSGIVGAGEFLEYLQKLRSAGSREGEARADDSGAVQIMTIHQAKGLEFRIVVLGDAAAAPGGGKNVLLDGEFGIVPKLERDERMPFAWRRAAEREALKEEAEIKRLLYVAATRARERLLVSGNFGVGKEGKLDLRGWLKEVGSALGISYAPPGFNAAGDCAAALAWGLPPGWPPDASVGATLYAAKYVPLFAQTHSSAPVAEASTWAEPCLLAPVASATPTAVGESSNRVWRVVPHAEVRWAPAWVVGKLVHAAIAAWRWPADADFPAWCQACARGYGLADGPRLEDALRRTSRLLRQLQRHWLYDEILAGGDRYHELPYTVPGQESPAGQIDLLFRCGDLWTLVDFKTDRIRDEHSRGQLLEQSDYVAQVKRYAAAVEQHLGTVPRCLLCLMDDRGAVSVELVCAGGQTELPVVQAEDDPAAAAWEQALEYAAGDCAGLLASCRAAGLPVPEVGSDLTDSRGRVIAQAELAWPDQRVALFLPSLETALLLAGEAGWRTVLFDDEATATAQVLDYLQRQL